MVLFIGFSILKFNEIFFHGSKVDHELVKPNGSIDMKNGRQDYEEEGKGDHPVD